MELPPETKEDGEGNIPLEVQAEFDKDAKLKLVGRKLNVSGDWPNKDKKGRPYYEYDPKHLTQGPPEYK